MSVKLIKILLLVVGVVFCSSRARAQFLEPRFGIHFSNPLGYLSKFGVKGEYRINPANALLINYTQYWGFFPGSQGYLEYRRYANTLSLAENFLYGKLGSGYSGYEKVTTLIEGVNNTNNYNAPGSYYFFGGGVGRHINFGAFFLDMNLGVKITGLGAHRPGYNEHLFFSTGPGSIVDLNFHFGFQFH